MNILFLFVNVQFTNCTQGDELEKWQLVTFARVEQLWRVVYVQNTIPNHCLMLFCPSLQDRAPAVCSASVLHQREAVNCIKHLEHGKTEHAFHQQTTIKQANACMCRQARREYRRSSPPSHQGTVAALSQKSDTGKAQQTPPTKC